MSPSNALSYLPDAVRKPLEEVGHLISWPGAGTTVHSWITENGRVVWTSTTLAGESSVTTGSIPSNFPNTAPLSKTQRVTTSRSPGEETTTVTTIAEWEIAKTVWVAESIATTITATKQ
jgi:hypothetical protein